MISNQVKFTQTRPTQFSDTRGVDYGLNCRWILTDMDCTKHNADFV